MSIANELITRGWRQGGYSDREGRVCLWGAMKCAALGAPMAMACTNDQRERSAAYSRALVLAAGTDYVTIWNDRPERTFDEVLRVAKEADEMLEQM